MKKAYITLGGFMHSIRFTPKDSELKNLFLSYFLHMPSVSYLSLDPYEVQQ